MGVRAEGRLRKRELVLAVARDLIHHLGYQNTAMKDIAKKAGLGMNAIYSVFQSKEQICAELYLEAQLEFAVKFRQVLAEDKPLPILHRELAELYIEFYSGHNFLYEIVWLVLDKQLDSQLDIAVISRIHQSFLELLEGYAQVLARFQGAGLIRQDIEPRELAAAFWSMVSGLAANYCHRTQEVTGVAHRRIREIELKMVLAYLRYQGGEEE